MAREIINLGKNVAVYGAGSVIIKFIGLFSLPFFTSKLSPEEYGILALLGLIALIAHPIFSLGLSSVLGNFYYDGNNLKRKSEVIWTGLIINSISVLILLLISFLFQSEIATIAKIPKDYHYLVSIYILSYSFTILSTCPLQKIIFENQSGTYSKITILTTLTSLFVSFISVWYFDLGAEGMVIGQLVANSLCFSLSIFNIKHSLEFRYSNKLIMSMIKLCIPIIISNIFTFFLLHSNKYILEWNYGIDSVGLYSIGFNLGATISIITAGVSMAWYPFFMGYLDRQSECKKIFGKILTYYIFGAGFICFLYFLFAKSIVMTLTSRDFHDAYITVGWIGLAFFGQTLFDFFKPGFYFKKELGYISLIQGFSSIFGVFINYILISKFGLLGAAIGLGLSNILMALFTYIWTIFRKKEYPIINYQWGRILKFLTVFISLSLIHNYINGLTIFLEFFKSIIFTLIGLTSFLFLLNSKEKKSILEIIRKRFDYT